MRFGLKAVVRGFAAGSAVADASGNVREKIMVDFQVLFVLTERSTLFCSSSFVEDATHIKYPGTRLF